MKKVLLACMVVFTCVAISSASASKIRVRVENREPRKEKRVEVKIDRNLLLFQKYKKIEKIS